MEITLSNLNEDSKNIRRAISILIDLKKDMAQSQKFGKSVVGSELSTKATQVSKLIVAECPDGLLSNDADLRKLFASNMVADFVATHSPDTRDAPSIADAKEVVQLAIDLLRSLYTTGIQISSDNWYLNQVATEKWLNGFVSE